MQRLPPVLTGALLLTLGLGTAHAATFRIDFTMQTAPDGQPQCGEGYNPPAPDCVASPGFFTLDTASAVTQQLDYYDWGTGAGPTLRDWQFSDIAVTSTSFLVDGIDAWPDPGGLTLGMGAQKDGASFPFDFGVSGSDTTSRSLFFYGLSLTELTQSQVENAPDPLALILRTTQFGNNQTGDLKGPWGSHYGNALPFTVTEVVPLPDAVWLLGTGLAGLAGRRWLRRRSSS